MTDRVNADQAKCHGQKCRVRWSCDRYVRPAAQNQTWFIVPEYMQGPDCPHRVDVVSRKTGVAEEK